MAQTKTKSKPAKAPKSAKPAKPETAKAKKTDRSWIEEIEVSSDKLVEKVRQLAAESSVRRIRIKEPDGDIAVDLPLTVGAVAGSVIVLAAPMLALIGALVAFFTKVKIEVVREEPKQKETTKS